MLIHEPRHIAPDPLTRGQESGFGALVMMLVMLGIAWVVMGGGR